MSSLGLLGTLRKTEPLRRAWKWALLAGAYSALPVLKSYIAPIRSAELSVGLAGAVSFALVLLTGFRVNRAYDRWWEARKLWGTLVNVSRNLAVKIRALHRPEAADRQVVRDLLVAYCVGLKDHLRDESDISTLPGFEKETTGDADHVPSIIMLRLYGLFERWHAQGKVSDEQHYVLDLEARVFLEVCGGCERIKNTLMSVSWPTFTRQVLFVLLLILPWGLVGEFGVLTIPVVIMIGYFVLAGEFVARVIEEPFGRQEDQLNLDSICDTIDRSVTNVLMADTE